MGSGVGLTFADDLRISAGGKVMIHGCNGKIRDDDAVAPATTRTRRGTRGSSTVSPAFAEKVDEFRRRGADLLWDLKSAYEALSTDEKVALKAAAAGALWVGLQEARGRTMANKRVFIAFAKEDERIRDLVKGQSLNTDSPFEYVDMSVKKAYDSEWKKKVWTRIKGSDGVIALLSKNSLTASGEKWEITCAVEEEKPLLGLYIYKNDRSKPPEMGSAKAIVWTWDGIAKFIDSL